MTIEEFKASLTGNTPPGKLKPLLQALWYDGKDDWDAAHELAQEIHTREGSWVHAYLHRKEGDSGNAAYWYHKANRPVPMVSLEEEWEGIVKEFLS